MSGEDVKKNENSKQKIYNNKKTERNEKSVSGSFCSVYKFTNKHH